MITLILLIALSMFFLCLLWSGFKVLLNGIRSSGRNPNHKATTNIHIHIEGSFNYNDRLFETMDDMDLVDFACLSNRLKGRAN